MYLEAEDPNALADELQVDVFCRPNMDIFQYDEQQQGRHLLLSVSNVDVSKAK
jgi:hypothetical protein